MRSLIRFILIVVTLMALFPLYTRFKTFAAPIPPGVYLGGLDLSDLKDAAEVREHLEHIYREPIAVYFAGQRLVLRPEDIDFYVDAEQMVTEASRFLDGPDFVDIAVREALGFEQQRRDIPVRYMLDADKLRVWLQQVAADQNRGPQTPRVLPPTSRWADSGGPGLPPGYVGAYSRDWTWTSGGPGYTLDLEASIPAVIAGLTRDQERSVDLVVEEMPIPPPSMADLQRELNSYLNNFPGFAAVYVHDLRTDEEATVDADVSFSGMSTLKIGLAAAIMHRLPNGVPGNNGEGDAEGAQTAREVGNLIDYALGESNNFAANRLLSFLGDGDMNAGARRFTDFIRSLGFVNTYMQSGYDTNVQLPEIPTPGNQRTDWDTNPDSNLQSTPAEMGRILSAIYECALGKGLLVQHYPEQITPDECHTILYYMSHDEFQEMIWAGLPKPNTSWIVHKHGFAFESHSDVALVWGPTGPYVISVFLFRRGWMDWETSNATMQAVSRITWNFFEYQAQHLDAQHLDTGPPAPLILTPPPGYLKIKDYIPVASTGFSD